MHVRGIKKGWFLVIFGVLFGISFFCFCGCKSTIFLGNGEKYFLLWVVNFLFLKDLGEKQGGKSSRE
jgi:hypothetical protein